MARLPSLQRFPSRFVRWATQEQLAAANVSARGDIPKENRMRKSLLLAAVLVCGGALAANAQSTRNPMGTETGPTMQKSNQAPDIQQGQSAAPRSGMAKKKKKKRSAHKH